MSLRGDHAAEQAIVDGSEDVVALLVEHKAANTREHPLAQDWLWPSYSRRTEGRDRIDLWSSRNEVATVVSLLCFGR
jgi:hypothetical protein